MLTLNTYLSTDLRIDYDGTQLVPHWLYRQFNLAGNTLAAFIGKADVGTGHMVDLEDVKRDAPIYSPEMLHFLGEWFEDSLETTILRQHLLVCEIYEILLEQGVGRLSRRGNDLFHEGRKLSVSVATRSAVSCLIHVGVNIRTEGTPVPTSGLKEIGIDPLELARAVLERFERDAEIWWRARVKVIPR